MEFTSSPSSPKERRVLQFLGGTVGGFLAAGLSLTFLPRFVAEVMSVTSPIVNVLVTIGQLCVVLSVLVFTVVIARTCSIPTARAFHDVGVFALPHIKSASQFLVRHGVSAVGVLVTISRRLLGKALAARRTPVTDASPMTEAPEAQVIDLRDEASTSTASPSAETSQQNLAAQA